MASYTIKGTLQVKMQVSGTSFSLFPDSTYLSPDRKSAVFYKAADATAKLVELIDSKLIKFEEILKTDGSDNFLVNNLTQLALNHKVVELEVEVEDKKLTITGFTYPAN